MNTLVLVALAFVAIPSAFFATYLFLLTLFSWRNRIPPASKRDTRFDIIVPAHNEATVIERTVASLRGIEWPSDKFRVVVVADNCTDDTANLARAAGAEVWERFNTELRGKGYALAHAFELSREQGFADAVVVVDADTIVSTNLLEAFASRLEQGVRAVQVDYGGLNPETSWRTRLMTIAMTAFHVVRSRSRERLVATCGIRGNGWCLTHELLRHVPYKAFSLAEDLEFGIALGLADCRIAYADEAHVYGEMVSREGPARKQRERWERGRFALIRSMTLPLLREGVRRPSWLCLDLAFDLMLLPLSYVTLTLAAFVGLAATAVFRFSFHVGWLWFAIVCASSLVLHVARGWQLSRVGWRGLADIAFVPWFLAWKLALMLRPPKTMGWVRTDREQP